MKSKFVIVLLLLVLVPVLLFAWLGFRLASAEQERVDASFQDLAQGQLTETANALALRVEAMEEGLRAQLRGASRESGDAEQWRQIVRETPLVNAAFVQEASGLLRYPVGAELNERERIFLDKSHAVWQSGALIGICVQEQGEGSGSVLSAVSKAKPVPEETGWYSWFYNQGACFLYWLRDPATAVVSGVEVSRAALLSDLIAALPDSSNSGATYVSLLDASGGTLYAWGDPKARDSGRILASTPLAHPLGMWRLEMRSSLQPEAAGRFSAIALSGVGGWLIAAAVLIGALGFYLYRGHRAELHEAGQRVSFVNQVSHELKTPLTNIRMYAELLQRRVPEDDKEADGWLKVVVDESQRLSRLISNVLTFSHHKEGSLTLRPRSVVPDSVIDGVVAAFAPSLAAKGITPEFDANAGAEVRIDPDVLEQVLGNLVGNVEKYAAAGGRLWIESQINDGILLVRVEDAGQGIPESQREKIFDAFVRLGDQELTEGSAGTGIGLSIARNLARLHGGDLRAASPRLASGAAFEVQLAIVS